MSYILEALKKSDQQRQRGATPTLQGSQVTAAAPKRPVSIFYGLLAVVLLAAGIVIGWLRPWQAGQSPAETRTIAAESPVPITQQVVQQPLAVPPEMPGNTARANPVVSNPAASNSVAPGTASPVADKPARPADVAQQQNVIPFNELPPAIQQEIPAMAVQLHAYSNIPGERLVSINSIRLREGGSLMLGLTLEQITPDGMIFSYKGYRFQRGIR
ncbi:MAG: general secretion pathway protein GspB [Gallionella sp.]